MYEELVTALRTCVDKEKGCSECPYYKRCIHNNTSGKHAAMVDAADAIEELMRRCEQFQYMPLPAWIPVTERLPEIKEHHVSDTVLVYLDDGGMTFDELEENIFGQTWFSCEHSPSGETEMTVTHWMELPKPPREEETDQQEEPEINPCRGCLDYDGRNGCASNGGCGAKMEVEHE